MLTIAEGYVTWNNEINSIMEILLSNHTYGVASLYCYYYSNMLKPWHELFTYLCKDQNSILQDFKKKSLATATGLQFFTDSQLQNLALIVEPQEQESLPTEMHTPCILNPNKEQSTLGQPSKDQVIANEEKINEETKNGN
jgi:hypothetical protein